MARRTTINDVAKAASVGKVTVSYVLNGRAGEVGISAETSERIFAIARELDYRPNAVARMLARKTSDSIAVVFQHPHYFSVTSFFLNEAMRGVCEECVELGLDVMLHTKPTRDPSEESNALSDGRVDGVLMLRDAGDPTLTALLERRFPVVLFFCRTDDPSVSYVDCDNFSGGKIAASHLLSLGHKRLGMVVGSAKSVDSSDRFQGFRSSVEGAGLSLNPADIASIEAPDSPADELIAMLSRSDRPTALFVWSDDVAFECMCAIRDLGLRIPEDVSLVGFDGTAACGRMDPPLTSVRQPILDMARKATQILKSLIKDENGPAQQIVFPPHLDIRGSTAKHRI
jgi:LacI family transcriptional regulator